jgi:hypothetical protein
VTTPTETERGFLPVPLHPAPTPYTGGFFRPSGLSFFRGPGPPPPPGAGFSFPGPTPPDHPGPGPRRPTGGPPGGSPVPRPPPPPRGTGPRTPVVGTPHPAPASNAHHRSGLPRPHTGPQTTAAPGGGPPAPRRAPGPPGCPTPRVPRTPASPPTVGFPDRSFSRDRPGPWWRGAGFPPTLGFSRRHGPGTQRGEGRATPGFFSAHPARPTPRGFFPPRTDLPQKDRGLGSYPRSRALGRDAFGGVNRPRTAGWHDALDQRARGDLGV